MAQKIIVHMFYEDTFHVGRFNLWNMSSIPIISVKDHSAGLLCEICRLFQLFLKRIIPRSLKTDT